MLKFLSHLFTWWNGHTLGTIMTVWRRGEPVGEDEQGNRYYRERRGKRRWVLYNGVVEASRIPPEWHAWLHYTVDEPPNETPPAVKDWEKDHVPNMTGTGEAWYRPGSLNTAGERHAATGDYEAWRP